MNKIKNLVFKIKENKREIIFVTYVVFTICYIGVFIEERDTLHFLDWAFISTIIFIFYISVISSKEKILKSVIIYSLIFLLLVFLKKESIKYIKISYINIIIFFVLSWINFLYKKNSSHEIKGKLSEDVYDERKEDFKKINDFLLKSGNQVNILGIDGRFGEGKSFLIDKFIEKVKKERIKEVEIIKIRCLLIEKEEVYSYISKQINRVLMKNFIFTGRAGKIKTSLIKGIDSKFFGLLNGLLTRETIIDDIDNFKKAILQLEKTIIIIFDDIDRVEDTEKIDKILAFISDFSKGNIKTLVLYHGDNLKKINKKYDRNYIEKYIPLTRELTTISFVDTLKKEISEQELNEEDFRFLFSIEGSSYLLYDDYNLSTRELKFKQDFEILFKKNREKPFHFTPRNIKNFIEELKGYLKYENLDIERRLIIGFTFLKHIMFEDFYEKIEENFKFENSFPIKLKFQDTVISLEEFDTINSLIKTKDKEKKLEEEYVDINNKRIFFNKSNSKNNINYYLNKLGIETSKFYETKLEIIQKIEEMAKKLRKIELEISDESSKNILIYYVLNYYLYSQNGEDKSYERNENIEEGIKKLKYFGRKNSQSSYRYFYESMSKVLEEKDLKVRNKLYNDLVSYYYHNTDNFKGIFYSGENLEEKIMKILNILGSEKDKKEFLKLIMFRNKNKITDSYIKAFCESKLKDIEISDMIVEKISLGEYLIEYKEVVYKIRKNITFILNRISRENIIENLDDLNFFKSIKVFLERKLDDNRFDYLKVSQFKDVKKSIEKYIKFSNEMIKILNDKTKEEKRTMKVSLSEASGDSKENELKNLSEKEIKEKIEMLLKEGKYSFNMLEEAYKIALEDIKVEK